MSVLINHNIVIKEADVTYRQQLNHFYRIQGYHSDWSATERAFIALDNQQIVGAVKVESINNTRILRGMYVAASHQDKGIGKQLLTYIEPLLNERMAYCLPLFHAADYYKKIGFFNISLRQLPNFLQTRYLHYQAQGYQIKAMQRKNTAQ